MQSKTAQASIHDGRQQPTTNNTTLICKLPSEGKAANSFKHIDSFVCIRDFFVIFDEHSAFRLSTHFCRNKIAATMGQGLFKSSYFYDLEKIEYTQEHKKAIEKQIATEPLLIFSKNYCPYCVETKRILESHDVVAAHYREINLEKDGLQTQAILFDIYGQKTVPNIFIKGSHIGGNAELHKLAKSGQLKTLLDAAHVPNTFT